VNETRHREIKGDGRIWGNESKIYELTVSYEEIAITERDIEEFIRG
jgi:hypothetical protein